MWVLSPSSNTAELYVQWTLHLHTPLLSICQISGRRKDRACSPKTACLPYCGVPIAPPSSRSTVCCSPLEQVDTKLQASDHSAISNGAESWALIVLHTLPRLHPWNSICPSTTLCPWVPFVSSHIWTTDAQTWLHWSLPLTQSLHGWQVIRIQSHTPGFTKSGHQLHTFSSDSLSPLPSMGELSGSKSKTQGTWDTPREGRWS